MAGPASARLELVAAALLFSTGGAAIKACELSSWQVAGLRALIAAIALVVLLPRARRGFGLGPALVACAYAVTVILFVLANKLTTSANTIFLQSAAPLYVLLLAPLMLGEPIRRADLGFLVAIVPGLALFFVSLDPPVATAPDPLRGNVLAVVSGVGWAFTLVGLRWLSTRSSAHRPSEAPVAAAVLGNLLAFVLSLPFALPYGDIRAADWAILAFLGIFQIGGAYALLTAGLRRVTALEASLLLLIEPVLNPIWAWLVHGEVPSRLALAGGAIVVGATAVKTVWSARARDLGGVAS
jgi:drug/metabolite transporter (DMT)-like permease